MKLTDKQYKSQVISAVQKSHIKRYCGIALYQIWLSGKFFSVTVTLEQTLGKWADKPVKFRCRVFPGRSNKKCRGLEGRLSKWEASVDGVLGASTLVMGVKYLEKISRMYDMNTY